MDMVVSAPLQSSAQAGGGEYLSFRLGQEEYGIDILQVQEIRSYEAATRIAGAPDFVRGVLNLRGVIVPIIDLRLKFGVPAEFNSLTVTVVLSIASHTVGVVVDSVVDVQELKSSEIQPAPSFNQSVDAGHITGLGHVTQGDIERLLILLDINRLLAGTDLGLFEA
ncbi:chemotaxis protein CheW [Paucibacter sp. JuS9]|uniref:chemotaxis protein CheW n=1 Tax=Roseateles TaxID=93681 RepID=UPI002FE57999